MPETQLFEDRSSDHLRLVLETSQIGVWELDLRSGKAIKNRTHDTIFGYSEPHPNWTYDTFMDHVAEADRERVDALQKNAIENSREWSFECEIVTAKGRTRWIKASGRPLTAEDGNVSKLIGHVIDITDIKRNEARLRLITEELNHRVRNMLAQIKSMVTLSMRDSPDIATFAKALEGRVDALARSHTLLADNLPGTLRPSAVLEAELSAHAGLEDRVEITVEEEVELSASVAEGLAMVFHELFTNAIKYGALSNDTGHVAVVIVRPAGAPLIVWKEIGGPHVATQQGKGFGSLLISSVLSSSGTVEQDFRPDGLECRIRLDAD